MKKFLSSQKGLAKISILFFVIDFIWKLSMMSMLNYKPKLTDTCYICNLFTIFFGCLCHKLQVGLKHEIISTRTYIFRQFYGPEC